MNKFLSVVAVVLTFSLYSCSSDQVTLETLSVSDYPFTLNGTPAISLSFGESQSNFCSLTLTKNSVLQGYSFESNQKNNDSMSIDCNWDGKTFVQSSKHSTLLKFSITELNKESLLAKATVSLNLVDPSNNEYFSLENIQLIIEGDYFNNLIKT